MDLWGRMSSSSRLAIGTPQPRQAYPIRLAFVNGSDEILDANFAVSDTDFRDPATIDLEANAAWTSADGSNVIIGWFADPNNAQGETLRLTRPE